jgi:5'-3' exonuclease
LTGDDSDGVRGLSNTGPVRATQILKTFSSVENLVEAARSGKQDVTRLAEKNIINKNKKKEISIVAEEKSTDKTTPPVSKYEMALFPEVRERADELLKIKKNVISLRELPYVKSALIERLASKPAAEFLDVFPTRNKLEFNDARFSTLYLWPMIRKYYQNQMGDCNEENERRHHCCVSQKKWK